MLLYTPTMKTKLTHSFDSTNAHSSQKDEHTDGEMGWMYFFVLYIIAWTWAGNTKSNNAT